MTQVIDEKQIMEAGLMPQEVQQEDVQIEIQKAQYLTLPDEQELEKRLKLIENALNFVERVKKLTLSKLTASDFVNYGGRPYLTADGAMKFVAPFGIGVKNLEGYVVREDGSQINIDDPNAFVGGIKSVKIAGIFYSKALGTEIEIYGGTTANEEFKNKDDFIFWLKKGQKNFYGYGIKYLLGLNSLTWEDLETVGIKKEQVKSVEFAKKETIDFETANKLWNEIIDKFNGDENKAKEWLKNTFGVKSTQGLTPKQADYLRTLLSKPIITQQSPQTTENDSKLESWINQFKLHAEKVPPEELQKILYSFGVKEISLAEIKKLSPKERNSLLQTVVNAKK
jgi:hypothetical protein